MTNFENFPEDLRLTDSQIANLSLKDIQKLFYTAEKELSPHEFADWQARFWSTINRIRSKVTFDSLQRVLKSLEEYKKNLGRHYAKHHSIATLIKYNETELDIRWLVKQYGLVRHSLPYLLPFTTNVGRTASQNHKKENTNE
jgi:hypothetical protein